MSISFWHPTVEPTVVPFTARELIEPLQTEVNCAQLFGMHCRGLVGRCILTMNYLQLMNVYLHRLLLEESLH